MKKVIVIIFFFFTVIKPSFSQTAKLEVEKKIVSEKRDSNFVKAELKKISEQPTDNLNSKDSTNKVAQEECVYIVPDFSKLTCFGDEYDSLSFKKLTQSPPVGTKILANDTMVRVFVVVVDSSSKVNTGCFNIKVSCDQVVYVPQFLSPNNDGANDTWEIPELKDFENNRIRLFDKYGNIILDLRDYKGGWNGVSNVLKKESGESVEVPDGQYVYTINLEGSDTGNTTKPMYGCLTIKR